MHDHAPPNSHRFFSKRFVEGWKIGSRGHPGFGDTYVDDADILRCIGSWLETTYDSRHKGETKLAGIVYLHDISVPRMPGPISKSLVVFQKLCGKGALNRVVLCTTKWSDKVVGFGSDIHQEKAERRTELLKESHWKEMIQSGSTLHKFEDSQKSAWDVIAPIIEEDRFENMDALQIQKELVEAKKLMPDTEEGQQLRYSLDQLLKSLKEASSMDSSRRKQLDARVAWICDSLRAIRVPATQRVLGLLDLGVDRILDKYMLIAARLEPNVKELIMCDLHFKSLNCVLTT